VACAAVLVLVLPSCPVPSQAPAACKTPKDAASISQINVVQGAAEVDMEKSSGGTGAEGIIRLYLRNEGPAEPNQLCASAYLSGATDKPQAVFLALSQPVQDPVTKELSQPGQNDPPLKFDLNTACFTIEPSWHAFQEMPFDLHFKVDSSLIPLTGPITLSSSATSSETSVSDSAAQNKKKPKQSNAARQSANNNNDCIASSKLLTQSVILLPSTASTWFDLPLSGALATALAYLLISLWVLRKKLKMSVGGPTWNFTSSFATNFTIGTGLLTPLIGTNVMTDALHYMTKFQYALCAILFAALLLLAPAVFSFFSTPSQVTTSAGQTSIQSVGSMGLFLATSALMIGGVIGQLFVVGLAMAEIEFRGYIGSASMVVILCLLGVAGIGTIVSAVLTIRSFLAQKPAPATPSSEHLRAIGHKFASLHPEAAVGLVNPELFSDQDRKVIEHVVKGPQQELRSWKMF
jgi:hypothetical protein